MVLTVLKHLQSCVVSKTMPLTDRLLFIFSLRKHIRSFGIYKNYVLDVSIMDISVSDNWVTLEALMFYGLFCSFQKALSA